MSLRGRIVTLFLALAVAPLVVVAVFTYVQAERAIDEVARVQVRRSAEEIALTVRNRRREIATFAESLASAPATLRYVRGSSGGPGMSELPLPPGATAPPALIRVEIRRAAGEVVGRFALGVRDAAGEAESACGEEGPRPPWIVERPVAGAGGGTAPANVAVHVDTDRLLGRAVRETSGGRRPRVVVVDRDLGEVLYATDCRLVEEMAASVATGPDEDGPAGPAPETSTMVERIPDDDGMVVVRADVAESAWSLVERAAIGPFAAPLGRLQVSYAVFVLLIAAATVAAFWMLLDRVIREVRELTKAAGKVGTGDLDPWLPAPGGDEIGRLSYAFGRMVDRVDEMIANADASGRMAVIRELTSYLAHEIRNPLSSIKLNLQSLEREVEKGTIPGDCRASVEITLREVTRLDQALGNVLKLGRRRALLPEECSLHGLIREVAELLREELAQAGVDLELQLEAVGDRVTGDPGQLKGVFVNLFTNAMQAMPEGGTIRVRSELVADRGAGPTVEVRVADEGPGIPAEARHRIFEPFFTTRDDGSGIGLAVAAVTVEEHKGDLYLEERSELAGGAEFVLRLSLAPTGRVAPPAPPRLPRGAGAGRRPAAGRRLVGATTEEVES